MKPLDQIPASADVVTFRRYALLATLAMGIPAAIIARINARMFPAATDFDVTVMTAILLGTLACALWAVLDRRHGEQVSLAFVALFGIGFALRIAGTFLGPYTHMPLAQLAPPYLAWMPLLFVLAFVLLQTRVALWASLAFYVVTGGAVAAYALPLVLAPGPAEAAVVGLLQQFLFGHLIYIVLLSVIPFLHGRYLQSVETNNNLRALRRSEDRFHDAFRYASIGMALVSPTGCFLSINDALCRLLGYSREELLGRDFQGITHPADLDKDLRNLQLLIQGETDHYSLEKRYFHRNGKLIWAVLSVSVVRKDSGEPDYFVSQIEDVTAAREYRVQLHESNRQLKRNAAELKRSNKELESFAYIVSHDLREPLRGVKGFAELLQKSYSQALDDRGREFVSYIVDSAQRGNELVSALLKVSRAGQAAPSEPVDSHATAQDVLANLRSVIQHTGAEIHLPEHMPFVLASSTALQAVLQNLLSNAIKFRREGVPPRIQVKVTDDGDTAEFSVRDNGQGFDEKFKDDIFEVFRRLHGREVEGTGIGLAICRKSIENHGGQISVESEPGVGTCFRFTLRLAPETTAA